MNIEKLNKIIGNSKKQLADIRIKEMMTEFTEILESQIHNFVVVDDKESKRYIRVWLVAAGHDGFFLTHDNYTELLPFINSRWKIVEGAAITCRMRAPIKDGLGLVISDLKEFCDKINLEVTE
ncbi:MAG: hypothetical protein WC549_01945 [Actinomycetota bacterium]